MCSAPLYIGVCTLAHVHIHLCAGKSANSAFALIRTLAHVIFDIKAGTAVSAKIIII